jgi:hypothetical protein
MALRRRAHPSLRRYVSRPRGRRGLFGWAGALDESGAFVFICDLVMAGSEMAIIFYSAFDPERSDDSAGGMRYYLG